jgi:hypothetical protein
VNKQLKLKERKKKKKLVSLPNHLARLRESFCLNTNTGADAEGVTPDFED